jgi:hypothetical protein
MIPDGIGIDFSLDQDFTSQVNGSKIVYYQDIIYKVSDNLVLHDSTKIAISPAIYNGDTLINTVTGGTITFKGFVKWTRTVWDDLTNFATTREVGFYSATTPTAILTIASPVANKQVDLQTAYNQAENVPVQSYIYYLYNSTGTTILQQSEVIYDEKLQYSFDGLVDGTTYQAQCIITNTYLQTVDSGKVVFSVNYLSPNINIVPTVVVNSDLGAVEIGIGQVIQNIGSSTGSIAYINNYLIPNNTGLQLLDSGSTVYWDVDIPADFTLTFDWNSNGFVSGDIVKLEDDDGNYYKISYDGNKFVLDLNGVITNGSNVALNGFVYVFGLLSQELYIYQNNVLVDYLKGWWV